MGPLWGDVASRSRCLGQIGVLEEEEGGGGCAFGEVGENSAKNRGGWSVAWLVRGGLSLFTPFNLSSLLGMPVT